MTPHAARLLAAICAATGGHAAPGWDAAVGIPEVGRESGLTEQQARAAGLELEGGRYIVTNAARQALLLPRGALWCEGCR